MLLSGLGPAWQSHVQAGTRAEGNFPPLRPRQCGGQSPRLPAARIERGRAPPENREKCRGGEGNRPRGPGERRRGEGESPSGRGECPGEQRKRPRGLGERPGGCPGLLPEREALRPGRTPPSRVASAEQQNARSGAASAESPGRPANPCRAGRAPRTPPAGALRADGDTRSPQGCAGGRAAPRRASSRRPAASPLTGTGRAAGHYSIGDAARPGEAREPSAAQEGAGDHVPRGGGGGRRRGAALSSRSAVAAAAAAGAGCRKSKHFGRKSES